MILAVLPSLELESYLKKIYILLSVLQLHNRREKGAHNWNKQAINKKQSFIRSTQSSKNIILLKL